MPNLKYDPLQPPTDLMDRPIAEGDLVAWGTSHGRSPAICVAKIVSINWKHKNPLYPDESREFVPCDPSDPTRTHYTLTLEVIKTTGDQSYIDADGVTYWDFSPGRKKKPKTLQLVKNFVKLEPPS